MIDVQVVFYFSLIDVKPVKMHQIEEQLLNVNVTLVNRILTYYLIIMESMELAKMIMYSMIYNHQNIIGNQILYI